MYLKQARLHALDGRFDEAICALIAAIEELAESASPTPEVAHLSEETKSALLTLRRAFFDLLTTAKGREWDELAHKYPFHLSFEELTSAVSEWVEYHAG